LLSGVRVLHEGAIVQTQKKGTQKRPVNFTFGRSIKKKAVMRENRCITAFYRVLA